MALAAFVPDLAAALCAEPLCQRLFLASIEMAVLGGLTAGLIRVARIRCPRRAPVATGLFATRTQVGRRIAALLDDSTARAPQLTGLSAIGIVVFGAVALSAGGQIRQLAAAASDAEGGRILHFPSDRSLGRLFVQDESLERNIISFHDWINGMDWYWTYQCEAQGDVSIPAGKRVRLLVGANAWRDLSPLTQLRPDDIYELSIAHMPADNRCMPHVATLTGLKNLHLERSEISATGLRHLQSLTSLERLHPPDKLSDSGLARIAELTTLKGLYVFDNRLTDAGLKHLAKLTALEELRIGPSRQTDESKGKPKQITNAGLKHLKALPRLHYLRLQGDLTNACLVHIKDLAPLRILSLSHLPITDAGLAHLANCTQLERLDLYGTQITDKGLVHLTGLKTLRMLALDKPNNTFDRKQPPITNAGMATLKALRSLEHLALPSCGVSDAGLAHLAELTTLKYLRVGTAGDSGITDAGLKHVARLRSLEELQIGGDTFTDEGMASIAALPNLRSLSMVGMAISVRELSKLTSLEYLNIASTKNGVKISDLNRLNALRNLTQLDVIALERDGVAINLSDLTKLEKLALSMAKGTAIRDDDLASLAGLEHLQWLQIGGFGAYLGASDAGLRHLANLTEMDRLSIGGADVTDAGLAHLARLHRLDMLTVTGNFTDAGLRHLEGLKAMQSLTIQSSNNFSPAAVARLREALPHLYKYSADPNRDISSKTTGAAESHLTIGAPAPPFIAKTLDGKPIALADYRGKVVLLYFWATWCKPCVASIPTIKDFQKNLSRFDDFAMISLSMDDNDGILKRFVTQHALSWPQVRIGLNAQTASAYGVSGAPNYFLIDRDGSILSTDKDLRVLHATATKALQKHQDG